MNLISYEELEELVKNKLSEKRFTHTKGVITRALEYASIYKVDIDTLKLVAMAHDYAKEFTDEENTKYIEKYNINLDEYEKANKNLLHAKIASYICKNEFGFTDEMSDAVKYHTTGKENMTTLQKILYLADATDPNRKYDSKYYVDTVKEDIDKGMVEVAKWVIADIVNKDIILHPDTVSCFNYYLRKIKDETK